MQPLEETSSEVVQSDLSTIVALCYFCNNCFHAGGTIFPLVNRLMLSVPNIVVFPVTRNKHLKMSLPFSGNIFLLVKNLCLIMHPQSENSLLH